MKNENTRYDNLLKDLILWLGVGLVLLSIYFSWDGLVKSVPTAKLTTMTKWVGFILSIGFTGIQFIFNSDFKKLNPTLFLLGIISYVYSITTNQWGIDDLFGFPAWISWIIAIGMDVAPEAMISWALEDFHKGDMIGNIFGKLGTLRRGDDNYSRRPQQQYTYTPEQRHQDTQPNMKPAQYQQNKQQHQGKKGDHRLKIFEE